MAKYQWGSATYQTNVIGNAAVANSSVAMGNTGGIANVTTMIPFFNTFYGGLSVGNVSTLLASSQFTYSSATGNLTVGSGSNKVTVAGSGNVVATGNISGNYIFGNGAFLTSVGGYSNSSVASYLASGTVTTDLLTTGNVSAAGNVFGSGLIVNGNAFITGNTTIQGNLIYNNLTNITTSNLVLGLGNNQTGINVTGAGIVAGNTNEASLLYNFTSQSWDSNINLAVAGNVTATGNIQGSYILGNGSQLTGLPAGYSNAEAVAYGEAGWAGNIIPVGNSVYNLGSLTNQWKDLFISNATIYLNGVPLSSNNANAVPTLIFNNAPIVTSGPNAAPITTTISTTANVVGATLVGNTVTTVYLSAQGNIAAGGSLSVQGNIVADNLSVVGTINLGAISVAGTVAGGNISTSGNVVTDGNVSVAGNVTANNSTTTNLTVTNINPSGNTVNIGNVTFALDNVSVPGYVSAAGNVTGNYILGNVAFATGIPATYGNSNVAAYLPTYNGTVGATDVNFGSTIAAPVAGGANDKVILYDFADPGQYNYAIGAESNNVWFGVDTESAGFKFYGGANVAATITGSGNLSAVGNISASYFIGNGSQLTGLPASYGNANVEAYLPTSNVIIGINSNVSNTNSNVANLSTSVTGIATNLGNTNANVTTLQGQVTSLTGNVYGNANVANYLPTYNGNVGGTLTTNSQPYVTSVGTLSSLTAAGNITGGNIATGGELSAAGNVTVGAGLTVSGDTTLQGNLSVQGNVTFTNSNVIVTNDKYVILANNQSTGAGVNGAGIVAGNPTVASFLYNDATASWQTNLTVTPSANNAVDLGATTNRWSAVYANTVNATAVTAATVAGALTTAAQPNVTSVGTLSTLSVSGNVYAGALYGDGYNLSNINAGNIVGTYGNSNVSNYLANGNDPTIVAIQGNVTTLQGNVTTLTGNLANTNNNLSNLSNIVASNSNDIITLQGQVTSLTGNVYGNANVAAYLPTYSGVLTAVGAVTSSGDVTSANLYTAGVLSATGNVRGGNINTAGSVKATVDVSAAGNVNAGNQVFGQTGFFNANLFVGTNANTSSLTNPVILGRSTGATFIQAALINENPNGSADFQAYAANGTDTQGWVDVGMAGNTFSDPAYTITKANDGYIFAQGVTGVGGNLVLATGEQGGVGNSDIIFAVGGFDVTNEILRIQNSSDTVLPYIDNNLNLGSAVKNFANLYVGNVLATTAVSTAGNVNAQYVNSVGAVFSGNVSITGTVSASAITGNITNAVNAVTVTGNAQGNINSVGLLSGVSVGGNILQNGAGNIISAQGNVYANNLSTTNDITAGGLFSAVGNVQINGITTISNNAIVTGNLNVLGNLVSVNQTNLNVSNTIIGLGRGDGNTPLTTNDGYDRGEQLWYYNTSENSAFIGWQNSTGNIVLASNASITNNVVTINSYGSATVGNLAAQGAVTATGNVTGSNITTAGLVTAATVNSTAVSATANVTGGNLVTAGSVTATANITAGNLNTAGQVVATANVTAGNVRTAGIVSATGAVYGSSFVGFVSGGSIAPSYTTQTVSADAQTIALSNTSSYTQYVVGNYAGTIVALPDATTATAGATYTVINNTGNAVSVQTSTGVVIAAQNNTRGIYTLLATANNNSNTWSYATQVATGGNTGSGVYVLATAPTFTNSFDGTATFNAFASVNTLNLGNGITTLNLGGNAAVASNTVVNLGVATVGTGNVKQINIGTNGATGSNTTVVVGTTGGTSNISLLGAVNASGTVVAAGNVTGGNVLTAGLISATANVVGGNVLTSGLVSGATVTGTTVSAAGNVVAGNVNTDGQVVAAGNVAGGNVLTSGLISATGTIASAANIVGGNITTIGLVSATGNIQGGNIVTSGLVSATGNVAGNYILGNVAFATGIPATYGNANVANYLPTYSGNLSSLNSITATGNITGSYFLGNGSQLTGIDATSIQNGTSNVRVVNNGNVTVGVAGTSNVAVFTTSGINVAGNVSAGNVSGGYITIANAVSIPSTAVATGVGATTVYTASSASVESVQLTVRAQIGSPATSVQMLQIMAAQDSTGNISYTVYDRVNTNTSVAAIPVTVTNTGSVISVALNSSSTTYYTVSVTEFANT